MKRKIKTFFIKLQMKLLYLWKVMHYPKETVLTINGEQVSKWRFIREGWKIFDDIAK